MIDPTTKIRRNPDVVFRQLEEEPAYCTGINLRC